LQQRATLPPRRQGSTIAAVELSFAVAPQVRNVIVEWDRAFPTLNATKPSADAEG